MYRSTLFLLLFTIALLPLSPARAAETAPSNIGTMQMLPPTPVGSTVTCPSGSHLILSYSGTSDAGKQGAINCAPIVTDAAGDIVTNGYMQMGGANAPCDGAHVGVIRFNPARIAFEGCTGSSWQSLGGGNTLVMGGCQTDWSQCPSGYHATSFFSPGTYNCCDRCGNPAWRYTVCSQ